jgi:dehydrogenase/reductase SDR family protein 12
MQFIRNMEFILYGMKHYTKWSKDLPPLEGSLKNQHVMVTGATTGLGLGISKQMAKRGAIVHMVCRDKEKGERVRKDIISETQNEAVFIHLCDLSLMRDIRKMSDDYSKQFKELHVLVNNVGVMTNKFEMTPEGFEKNFATNILGQYYLTTLMLPILKQTKPFARVINVSSGGMLTQPLILDDYFMEKDFDGTKQYARNKRQIVAVTEYFARLHTKEGVFFYSMHPGWVDTDGVRTSMPDFHKKFEKDLRPISQGIDTIDYLTVTP